MQTSPQFQAERPHLHFNSGKLQSKLEKARSTSPHQADCTQASPPRRREATPRDLPGILFLGMEAKGKGRDDEADQNLLAPKRELVIYIGTEKQSAEGITASLLFFN